MARGRKEHNRARTYRLPRRRMSSMASTRCLCARSTVSCVLRVIRRRRRRLVVVVSSRLVRVRGNRYAREFVRSSCLCVAFCQIVNRFVFVFARSGPIVSRYSRWSSRLHRSSDRGATLRPSSGRRRLIPERRTRKDISCALRSFVRVVENQARRWRPAGGCWRPCCCCWRARCSNRIRWKNEVSFVLFSGRPFVSRARH